MSNDPTCTAFVADDRDELLYVPISGVDSTTSVRQATAGLTLRFQMGGEAFCLDFDGSKWTEAGQYLS